MVSVFKRLLSKWAVPRCGYLFDRSIDRNVFSNNTVIAGLMQCGDVDEFSSVGHVVDAREPFDGTPVRNVQAWNAMMTDKVLPF
ncbi:hypothetical protein PS2_012599 [Malus domestica]